MPHSGRGRASPRFGTPGRVCLQGNPAVRRPTGRELSPASATASLSEASGCSRPRTPAAAARAGRGGGSSDRPVPHRGWTLPEGPSPPCSPRRHEPDPVASSAPRPDASTVTRDRGTHHARLTATRSSLPRMPGCRRSRQDSDRAPGRVRLAQLAIVEEQSARAAPRTGRRGPVDLLEHVTSLRPNTGCRRSPGSRRPNSATVRRIAWINARPTRSHRATPSDNRWTGWKAVSRETGALTLEPSAATARDWSPTRPNG